MGGLLPDLFLCSEIDPRKLLLFFAGDKAAPEEAGLFVRFAQNDPVQPVQKGVPVKAERSSAFAVLGSATMIVVWIADPLVKLPLTGAEILRHSGGAFQQVRVPAPVQQDLRPVGRLRRWQNGVAYFAIHRPWRLQYS